MNNATGIARGHNYTLAWSDLFEGIGGTYKLTRFKRDGEAVKVELYLVADNGLETFLGYVAPAYWDHPMVPSTLWS